MILCLVVTHADLGRELVRAVEGIAGPVPELACLTNEGLSLAGLATAVEDWLDSVGPRSQSGLLLLVDDRSGSCCQAVQLACRGQPGVTVLAGVNLAMLLAFASARDSLSLSQLAEKLLGAGTAAVVRVPLTLQEDNRPGTFSGSDPTSPQREG